MNVCLPVGVAIPMIPPGVYVFTFCLFTGSFIFILPECTVLHLLRRNTCFCTGYVR